MSTPDYRGFSNLQTKNADYDSEQNISVFNTAMGKLRILSCVTIAVGSALVLVGIVIVANIGSHAMFPFTSGSQIWSGFVVLAQGIMGFRATAVKVDAFDDIPRGPLKCLFGVFYGFLISSLSTNGINLGYSISGILICSEETCADNDILMLTMSAFGVFLAVCAYICTCLGLIFICKYRRRLGFVPERKNIVFNQSNAYGSSMNTLTISTPQSSSPPPYSEKN